MDGLLLVDKAKGWTSFDVVAKVRGLLKKQTNTKVKVGHTGTLDPLATGLLVLTIGSYCKRAGEFSKLDKIYQVEMKLGQVSTTDDAEGTITPYNPTPNNPDPNQEKFSKTSHPYKNRKYLEEVMQGFVGESSQVPPVFSAIKVDGKRAYKLAREGKEVELKPRKITVHSLQLTEVKPTTVRFTAHVSSGTYIRSLVRDIGQKLGCGAYMSDLRRTRVGKFDIKDAHQIGSLESGNIEPSKT